MTDLHDVIERAAILEYECGMSRADAETQALGELCDRAAAHVPPGILGELVAADRVRRSVAPEVGSAVGACRLPWGFGWLVAQGERYRPAEPGEGGSAAFIAPAVEGGVVIDLAAQSFATRAVRTRLGAADLLGADDVAAARESGTPLCVFASVSRWLRGGCHGAVILDWRRASVSLDGMTVILCDAHTAPRLRDATRHCHPPALIAVPARKDARHAA